MRVLITGSAGFIGFHLARLLPTEGVRVHGFDGMRDYHDVTLKTASPWDAVAVSEFLDN